MKFKDTIQTTFSLISTHKRPLAKALLAPFIFTSLLGIAQTELSEPSKLASLSFFALNILVQTIFAIITHRIILLGPNSVPNWGLSSWSKRETFFALHVFAVYLIIMSPNLISFMPVGTKLVLFLAVFWLIGRLSLVFPAIAVEHGVTFKLSWTLTKNRGMFMLMIILLFPIIMAIPIIIISMIPYMNLLATPLTPLITVFTVTALSVTYRYICNETYES